MLLALLACAPDAPLVPAIVDPARTEHFFDLPFPSDELRLVDGRPDLTGFPAAPDTPLGGVVAAWASAVPLATWDFSANAPAWFRFEGPLALPATTDGHPDDPVLLIDLDRGTLVPLELLFVEDPGDDPFFAPNTLSVLPRLGSTPPSGARLAAVVTEGAGAGPAPGWAPPTEVVRALEDVGAAAAVAVSTVYTVQDAATALGGLHDAVEATLNATPGWADAVVERVVRLEYRLGQTDSGHTGTAEIVTFEGGRTETTWLSKTSDGDQVIELDANWPMEVFQITLPVPYFQGLADRPFMRPGAAHLLDTDTKTGWIDQAADGTVLSSAELDALRVVVSVPWERPSRAPVLVWDHGTAGSAYNHVQRKSPKDDGRAINERFAAAGIVVVGRDASLYGARYPLVEEGYTDGSLGFYNIVNLPAFRDNQRASGVEGAAVARWAEQRLDDAFGITPGGLLRGGSSLGAVTANLGIAADPDRYGAGFVSGAGSVFALSFLETGLAGTDSAIFETLADLFGVTVGPEDDLGVVIGAALGITDEQALARLGRHHPAIALFQWIVDPSDPSTFAEAEAIPITLLMGIGDWQIPNTATEALHARLPQSAIEPCEALADYDPHYCLWREPQGWQILGDWLPQP